jgi:hypothetical protein
MRARLGAALVACALGVATTAQAEVLTREPLAMPMLDAPEIPRGPKLSEQIASKLTLFGDVLDAHLGELTLDALELRIDGRRRTARVKLEAAAQRLGFCLDGHVRFERGLARVATRIDLSLGGREWHLDLPEFEMVPRSYGGDSYVELRLPLIEGSF